MQIAPGGRIPDLGSPTLDELVAMTDEELGKVDPLVVNLVVARGVPGWERLDIGSYVRQVDAWAAAIRSATDATEQSEKETELYKHDPDLWRAGGMSIMLAGKLAGIRYTKKVEHADASQFFVNGLIDSREGTCANMPVLYLAIGHRLGWPLKAVVSRDHMWVRWDDGQGGVEGKGGKEGRGGKRFNLEATSAAVDGGGMGTFMSQTDEQIAAGLGTPRELIENGSDFTSLTPRQTLSVYLQGRAVYWLAKGEAVRASGDAEVATRLFPKNYNIQQLTEYARQRVLEDGRGRESKMAARERSERQLREWRERENETQRLHDENQRRMFPGVNLEYSTDDNCLRTCFIMLREGQCKSGHYIP